MVLPLCSRNTEGALPDGGIVLFLSIVGYLGLLQSVKEAVCKSYDMRQMKI
jgi:hypothetical protein